jgi:hypothetical protein
MSGRRALAYIVLALALGAAYFLATRWESRQGEKKERTRLIFDLEAGQVDALKIHRAGEPEIVVEKVPRAEEKEGKKAKDVWRITAPGAFAADARAVKDVIKAAVGVKKDRAIEKSVSEVSPYGLDAPALRVSLRAEGRWHGLDFGAQNFSGDSRYVRVEGSDAILLVTMSSFNRMDRGLEGLRDRRILPIDEGRITAIEITRGDQSLKLEKGEKGWSLVGSPRPVSEERVESLIDALTESEVERFVSEKDGDRSHYGLDAPDITVTLTLGEKQAWLRIAPTEAQKDPAAYAARSSAPGVIALARRVVDALPTAGADLEDKRLLRAEATAVHALRVAHAGKQLGFLRTEEGWRRQDGEKGKEEKEAPDVEAFLATLEGLHHDGAPAEPVGPLPDPEVRLRLASEGDKPLLTLAIARPVEGETVRRARLADDAGERGVQLSSGTLESLYDALQALDARAAPAPREPEASKPASAVP